MQQQWVLSGDCKGFGQSIRMLDVTRDDQHPSPTTKRLLSGLHQTPQSRVTIRLNQQGNVGIPREQLPHRSGPGGCFDRRMRCPVECQPLEESLAGCTTRRSFSLPLGRGIADLIQAKD